MQQQGEMEWFSVHLYYLGYTGAYRHHPCDDEGIVHYLNLLHNPFFLDIKQYLHKNRFLFADLEHMVRHCLDLHTHLMLGL